MFLTLLEDTNKFDMNVAFLFELGSSISWYYYTLKDIHLFGKSISNCIASIKLDSLLNQYVDKKWEFSSAKNMV